jgi:hypothetical protein
MCRLAMRLSPLVSESSTYISHHYLPLSPSALVVANLFWASRPTHMRTVHTLRNNRESWKSGQAACMSFPANNTSFVDSLFQIRPSDLSLTHASDY